MAGGLPRASHATSVRALTKRSGTRALTRGDEACVLVGAGERTAGLSVLEIDPNGAGSRDLLGERGHLAGVVAEAALDVDGEQARQAAEAGP
jgi:hypothetical protein